MKKLLMLFVFFLFSFSIAYSQEIGEGIITAPHTMEIHTLEDVSETDFEGTWIPFVQYLRFFKDVIALDDTYAKDYILINNKHIYITIVGNTFTDLPYKFDDNAVLTAINGGTKNEILVTLRLLGEDYMLYSLFFDGKTQGELLCYRLEAFRQ
jgi:hypothetical protein